jgi:sortase A
MHMIRTRRGWVLMLGAFALLAQAGWISAKAEVAQWLLADAYDEMIETGVAVRPWRWADTEVSGQLRLANGKRYYLLNGPSGEALAFGPSRLNAGNTQAIVIGGHRDTHLGFLADARPGDRYAVILEDGHVRHYALESLQIADVSRDTLLISPASAGLVMVTCYPVNSILTGGNQRLIAIALPIPSEQARPNGEEREHKQRAKPAT